jgi:hypothetical protein
MVSKKGLPMKGDRAPGQPYLAKEPGLRSWYVCWIEGRRLKRRSARTEDRAEAEAVLAAVINERNGNRPCVEIDSWSVVAAAVCRRQKISAKARGIPFQITAGYVLGQMRLAGYRCPVSGIAFTHQRDGGFHKNPWAPSVDRIDNRQGYVPGNIRVVCLAVNLAMNEWGYDVLLRLAHAVVASSYVSAPEKGAAVTLMPYTQASKKGLPDDR